MANFPGTPMDDMFMGTAMDDVLWGGPGDDQLSGGAGNDRLIGGPGADMLNGGSGMDIASYTDSPMGVHVDMSTPFADAEEREPIRGGHAEGDTLGSIEIIWGSNFSDVIKGTHSHNQLFGNGGSDMLYGMRGNDLLRGGYDDDQLMGGDGMDTLYGDMGVDDLQGGMGNDMLFGGEDDDVLDGGGGDDVLEGGPGADDLMGGTGSDTAAYTMSSEAVMVDLRYPMPSDPRVKAPMGGDAMGDMIGRDIENLRGSMYDDVLIGDDMMSDDASTTDVDESKVYHGKNKLYGNMGNDKLMGMGADDMLYGGKGMDTLYGGKGNDTLMGELGDDALKGDEGDDTLMGGPGADKLFGGKFDAETMMPGDDDSMNDTADYSKSDAGVQVNLGAISRTTGKVEPTAEGGHAEGDALNGIENLTGSSHADMLMGDGENNVLKGGMGDDWDNQATTRVKEAGLFGGAGDDTLEGGAGNDWLDGGDGKNYIMGGTGNDMLIGGEMAELYVDAVPASLGADGVVGGGDDTDAVPAMKYGLFGGSGDDTLRGGAGGDTIDGQSGNDTADYKGSDAGVTIDLGTTTDHDSDTDTPEIITASGGHAAGDVLMGIENVTGSSEGDTLTGDRRANVLAGGDGTDALMGGAGADTFVFGEQANAAADTIADFSPSQGDKIDLTALSLTAADLQTILHNNNYNADGTVITLRLGAADSNPDGGTGIDVDGGTITVTIADRFTTLDADDFII